MTNELLKVPYVQERTVFVTVLSPNGLTTYNLVSRIFEAENPSNFTQYLIPVTDVQNNGLYIGDFPTELSAGNYPALAYEQVGSNYTRIGNDLILWTGQAISTSVTITQSSYSDVDSANSYFNSRLHSEAWLALADSNQKQQALNQATQILERFAYVGHKTDPNQVFEWPRCGVRFGQTWLPSDVIPSKILQAQFEIAYALLIDGIDLETQQAGLRITSRRLVGVSTTYDSKNMPEWMEYGVPSYLAWTLIYPYLDRSDRIRLDRVS